jgi:Ca2+-binding EF-hand superfamily protein
MKRFSILAIALFALALSIVAFGQDRQAPQNSAENRKGRQHAGKLKKFDANQDGQITRDEWKGKDDNFQKLDRNSDGIISREEMAAGRQQFGKQRLKQMDANQDRQISRGEWSGDPELFNRLDRNNDGVISGRELKGRRAKNNRNRI